MKALKVFESSIFKPKTIDEIKKELEEKYLNRIFKNVHQEIFHIFDIVHKGDEDFRLMAHPLFNYNSTFSENMTIGMTPIGFDNWAKPVDKEQLLKITRSKYKRDIILNSR